MIVVGLAGIMVGDSIIFRAGLHYGDKLLETRLGKHISKERVVKVRELFARHGPKLIMVARFLPGLRAPTFFVAGSSGVPYWKFFCFDGLAALVSAPLWVLLGNWAGRHHALVRAMAAAKRVQFGIFIALGAGAVLLLGWWLWKKRGQRLKAAAQKQIEMKLDPPSRRNGAPPDASELPAERNA